MKLNEMVKVHQPVTMAVYCAPGVGKSTFLGIIGEQSKGRTLVVSIDNTFVSSMAKDEVVHDFDRIDVEVLDSSSGHKDESKKWIGGAWNNWEQMCIKIRDVAKDYENICIDNVSELERAILSDRGRMGNNNGVPSQADYQYMQFRLVDSLRMLKNQGVNVYLTFWETTEAFINPDGTQYTRSFPMVSKKIVDNICGLCDVVAKVIVNKAGERGLVLEATQNIYAKNQRDSRKTCNVKEFLSNG